MKTYIFRIMMFTMLITGCTKKEDNGPVLSFTQPVYFLTKQEPLLITVYVTQNTKEELRIPFTTGGSAQQQEDYELRQHEFVIPAGADSASITVLPKENVIEQKEIRLELQPVAGYSFGRNKVAMIPVETQEVITGSFDKNTYEVSAATDINMLLYLGTRAYTRPSKQVEVPFVIDAASTAIENVHYRLSSDRRFLVMGTGSLRASIRIVPMLIEEGKNTIVLRLADSKRFLPGLYYQTTIELIN
jgi:hypothetical protein